VACCKSGSCLWNSLWWVVVSRAGVSPELSGASHLVSGPAGCDGGNGLGVLELPARIFGGGRRLTVEITALIARVLRVRVLARMLVRARART
jgi:hypothetical protein